MSFVSFSDLQTILTDLGNKLRRKPTAVRLTSAEYDALTNEQKHDTTKTYYVTDMNPGGGGGSYELPIASASELGGIKVGNGLSINANTGVLSNSNPAPYSLPTASTSTLGGVKVGSNTLSISDGVLNTKQPENYRGYVLSLYNNTSISIPTGFSYKNGSDITISKSDILPWLGLSTNATDTQIQNAIKKVAILQVLFYPSDSLNVPNVVVFGTPGRFSFSSGDNYVGFDSRFYFYNPGQSAVVVSRLDIDTLIPSAIRE